MQFQSSSFRPLQGRLFAQWLHHLFPHDIVFLHSRGVVALSSFAYSGRQARVIQAVHCKFRSDCRFPSSGGVAASSSLAYARNKRAWNKEMRCHIRDWTGLTAER